MAKYLFIFLFLRPFKCKMGWCDSLTVFTGLIHVNVNVYLFSQVFMYSVIIIFFSIHLSERTTLCPQNLLQDI